MRSHREQKEEETKGESKQEEKHSEEKQSRFSARVGASVVRNIEGIWFPAVVESIDVRRQTCTIKYLDDDNLETVLIEELRGAEDKPSSGTNAHRGNDTVRNPLPRPLAGLVEDDYEERNNHRPTVTVHTDANTEEGIIINGAESTLAVGGGLRALRYLKS